MFRLLLFILALWPQGLQKPLPDRDSFLSEFRKTLKRDEILLSQYTYTQSETEITLDSKGRPKKTEVNVYQVTHGREEWQTYRRHISKNGVPLPDKDIEKQDREERERVQKELRKRQNQSEEKRLKEKAKEDREEEEITDEVFAMYDVQMIGREEIGGHSTILMTFKAKPNYKPKTRDAKILQHIAGRVWVTEDDHQLAKMEAEIIDSISIGAGFFAKLNKGSTLTFERRKINDEIWLPVKADVTVNGRLLLLKGLNVREVTEFSDHKKFNVDTILSFPDVIKKPQ